MKDDPTGQRARHATYGEGQIVATKWAGAQVRLKVAKTGLEVWVPRGSVQLVPVNVVADPAPATRARATIGNPFRDLAADAGIPPPPPRPRAPNDAQARRMVEAFRLGIVPSADVIDFTLGRDEEIERIMGILEDREFGNCGYGLVVEDYGGGKTHFLEFLYRKLQLEGYAVARAAFNKADVPPYSPLSLYRELMKSLSYQKDGEAGTFRTLLREHADNGTAIDQFALRRALDLLGRGLNENDEELAYEWIEGEPGRRSVFPWWIPLLYDHGTAVDNYCNLLTAVSQLVKKSGLKGLVLLVDEAELIFRQDPNMTMLRQDQAKNLLGGLLHISTNGHQTFNTEGGHSWTLKHHGSRPQEFIHAGETNVYTFFAFTKNEQYLTTAPSRTIELRPFDDDRGTEIINTIEQLYARAYPANAGLTLHDETRQSILHESDGHARAIMKATVESLDLLRFSPEETVDENA